MVRQELRRARAKAAKSRATVWHMWPAKPFANYNIRRRLNASWSTFEICCRPVGLLLSNGRFCLTSKTQALNRQWQITKILKVVRLFAINLLILFVLFEITSVVVYLVRTGEFFYTRSKADVSAARAQFEPDQSAPATDSLLFQLHPSFGFVKKQDPHSNTVNSSGFTSQYQYPFKKTSKDQFVIGVFGGSVAAGFTAHELQTHVLESALKRMSWFRNKEIVFLGFANGAYKQPQQLQVLSYFLSVGQDLDMVINIDGFNEAALSYQNVKSGLEHSMPASILMLPLSDLANKDFSSETLAQNLEVQRTRNQVRDALAAENNCRLASCYTLRWIQARVLIKRYQEKINALNAAKSNSPDHNALIHLDKNAGPLDDRQIAERTADVWAQSSLMMNELLTARKILYFHIIQPNQYYPTRRQFSAEERSIAIDENNPNRIGVENGYAGFLARIGNLRASGVKVFDGASVLDQVKGIVYSDNCCHYSKLGKDVFGKYVADTIVASLSTGSELDKDKRKP